MKLGRLLQNDWAAIVLLGLVQGLLSTLSLAPFNFPLLVWLAPWPLFYFAARFRNRTRMLLLSGAISSLWLCTFSFYWMLHLFRAFGGLPLWLSLLIFLPYTIVLNLKSPLFVLLLGAAQRSHWKKRLPAMAFLAAVFGLLTDFLTPQIFPWYWGNLLAGNPWLVQWAEVGGVYALTFVLFGGSYVGYRAARVLVSQARRAGRLGLFGLTTRRFVLKRWLPVPAVIVLLLALGGARKFQLQERQRGLDRVRVAALQPNAPLEKAGERRVTPRVLADLMNRRIPLLAQEALRAGEGRVDLLVLPESAVPYYSAENSALNVASGLYSPLFEALLLRLTHASGAEVFFNEVTLRPGRNALGEYTGLAYNSSALVNRQGRRVAVYDKQKLLAFGEYVPGVDLLKATGLIGLVPGVVRGARFQPGTRPQLIPYSRANTAGHAPGSAAQAGSEAARSGGGAGTALRVERLSDGPGELRARFPQREFRVHGEFLPLICYEVLSPELVRSFFLQNATNPDFMVNITQDAWYGRTIETYQHYELGRIRSVETRRALVRATNSGSSGFVDIVGNYVRPTVGPRLTEQEVETFQIWDVPVHRAGPTLYVRFGNLWMWLPVLGLLAAMLRRRLRKRVAE